LTNFSKNSFYLLPEPLRRGEFLTNYWNYGGEKIIAWMPIPSFDEILEANKDVFKRLKSK
jgi:hypothetical protein